MAGAVFPTSLQSLLPRGGETRYIIELTNESTKAAFGSARRPPGVAAWDLGLEERGSSRASPR